MFETVLLVTLRLLRPSLTIPKYLAFEIVAPLTFPGDGRLLTLLGEVGVDGARARTPQPRCEEHRRGRGF